MKVSKDFVTDVFPRFLKYVFVGCFVTLVDLSFLYFLVESFEISPVFGAVFSFLLAVLVSFILNKNWTFENTSKNYRKLFVKFWIVSCVGLGLTVALMYIFSLLGVWYILGKALTSGLVLVWNFLANFFWTFQVKKIEGLDFVPTKDLSVVVPAYNEENRIIPTLKNIVSYLNGLNEIDTWEVLVVDDGSKDSTVNVVKKLDLENVRVIVSIKNGGKGSAFKKGVLEARGKYVLMCDADESTPISEFEKLYRVIDLDTVCIGSRYIKGSQISKSQPKYRILMGRIANFMIRIFFFDGIRDTQCGFKLFPTDKIKYIVSFQKVMRFGFDMEVILLLLNNGLIVKEVPVIWNNVEGSRVRPLRDSIRTFMELLFIKFNLVFGRYNK